MLIVSVTPIPMAARSEAWVCSLSFDVIWDLNPAGCMDICVLRCCVWSGIVLCIGLITRPEESYQMLWV
jgi:hypothetical protein